ncbi:MAG: hypothetical protein JW789_04895 [Candidatus Aenigmarchaeota archaeon]|nr:hypothetical protein [Candidatus Aenigmarchaeota archaeon]
MTVFDSLPKSPDEPAIKKKDYQKLLVNALKSAESAGKKGENRKAALAYQRLSVTARRAREWDDGMKYALLSANYSENEKEIFNSGWSYRSAALAAKGKGDYRKTIEYALEGAKRFKETGSIYAAKWCYSTAGLASKLDGRPDQAIKYFERANTVDRDDETIHEIYRLKSSVSHPRVDQYAERDKVMEGDPVRFEIVVENHSKEILSNVVVGDRDAKITHEIDVLKPSEVRIFAYETKGRMGTLESPYNFITWKNQAGVSLDFELKPTTVTVLPKLQITQSIFPAATMDRTVKLVVLVKNLTTKPLYDIKVDMDFETHAHVPHPAPKTFGKIMPGEEFGAEWSMKLLSPGEHRIASGKITLHDEFDVRYDEKISPKIFNVVESAPELRAVTAKPSEISADRKTMKGGITSYPLAEGMYIELEKRLFHQQHGYTIRTITEDVAAKHVRDNCADMAEVAAHDYGSEKVFMYSFRMNNAHYLLTSVIKKDEDFVHIILKLYSERNETLAEDLKLISDVIINSITTSTGAKEVEKVEIKKIINIIDSVVQRSKIGAEDEGTVTEKKTDIKDSVVQRTDV